jgi:hypothetical protein
MLTVEEIAALATAAASGGRKVVFQSLAREVGVVGRPGGWIYLPGGTKPVAHGWQAFAQLLSGPRVGFTGRDLLVEMSKASVSPADLAAAEREAHAMNVPPASAVKGRDQRRDFYREVSRRIVGPHSAQAERYAKRQLIAELHDEALAEDARRAGQIVVGFDRIGRHGTTSLRFDVSLADNLDEIVRLIRKHIRTNHLIASREYDVHVDVEAGVVLLDGGRFGRGSISGLPSRPADELPDCECHAMRAPHGAHAGTRRRF